MLQSSHSTRLSLKEVLIEQGLINHDQLDVALQEQQREPRLLGEILVELEFISSQDLQNTLSFLTGYPVADLRFIQPNSQIIDILPYNIWKEQRAAPFAFENNIISIAMADPENIVLCDNLKRHCNQALGYGFDLAFYHADPRQIDAFLQSSLPLQKINHSNENEDAALEIIEAVLFQAIRLRASDIHFQPEQQTVQIRYRLDGMLKTLQVFHKTLWPSLCVCLKIMAGVDIAESRRPQSGHFERQIGGNEVDFRLSTHPTVQGESIVVRVLDKGKVLLSLEELGFSQDNIEYLKKMISLPQGMIILSGPTGAGKTTTLYALFSQLDSRNKNIMTLEEPVEYRLSGIRQTEIREGGPIGFSEGVRSILRHDPDIIFIGEIRDENTARMALRSAMTGHLVIATLHTHDSFGVPARLIDLGLQPSLLSGHMLCAVAQRLVRKVCLSCSGKGCVSCYQIGYKGRTVVAEILPFNDDLNHLVEQGGSRSQILQYSREIGCETLWDDAQTKLRAGITTAEEIKRVLGEV